jgi:toxin-antitoxin system PIN domain toxin
LRALLDVNVLVALLDASHAFHQRAHDWWTEQEDKGWASCPLTENGLLRIMAHPGYSRARRFTVEELVQALSKFVAGSDHEFWPDFATLRDDRLFATDRILSSRQLTDVYLLALAVERGGRMVTFDQGIPISTVRPARPENLSVL